MKWNKFTQLLFLTAFLLLSLPCMSSLDCRNYAGSCQLHLDSDIPEIDQSLLETCPVNCVNLSILSADLRGRSIHENAFQKFSQLSSLSIRSNLTSVQSFLWLIHLKNLKYLDLSHCELGSLTSTIFNSVFPSLESVDLSHNDLEFLYLPFLHNTPQLRYLNISWNRFRSFPDIPSKSFLVNIAGNPLECTCTNVYLSNRGNFLTSDFNCTLAACPYFLSFENATNNRSLFVQVAKSFEIICSVNASNAVKFGVFSPINFIPGPSWDSSVNDKQVILYEYVVLPIQRPVNIKIQKVTPSSLVVMVDYARGHHGGIWQCVALSDGGVLLDKHPYNVIVSTGIDRHFLNTTFIGFLVMAATLALGLIIGAVRFLIDTHCFRRPQSHKFVVRPLIGVIPVPAMQTRNITFTDEISLNERICQACLLKPSFLCGYCLSLHAFTQFEVLSGEDEIPGHPPQYRCNESSSPVDASSLLNPDCSPFGELKFSGTEGCHCGTANNDENNVIAKENGTFLHKNVLNYDFPSVFCHCYHLDMRFTDGDTRTSTALRDVKLIFRDEQLAQEYTEVLEVLQAAAKSNDATTFRDRLEDFRGRLVRDVGARVRVAREEIVALKERSAKSVARLRDQSGAVAHLMKAGFSQMREGMRSVAEMCTGGGSGTCDHSATDLETIGQSICVVSVYKDKATKKPKERCVSNFTF